jgi:predicted HD phosphohydrolase
LAAFLHDIGHLLGQAEYLYQLSEVSMIPVNGGPMSALEVALLTSEMHPQYLKLRRWDEAVKSEELADESLESL